MTIIVGYVMIAIGAVIIAFRLMGKSLFSAMDPKEYPTRASMKEQHRHRWIAVFQIFREDVPAIENDLAARALAFAIGLIVIGLVIALFA